MKRLALRSVLGILAVSLWSLPSRAADELITTARIAGGETIPYVLTSKPGKPSVAVILMPGGRGLLNLRQEGGKILMELSGNFLTRSRELFADGRIVAISTDATTTPERIMAVVQDLQARFGSLSVYILGTSRSTESTMALARRIDGQVEGFVHSSSVNAIASFDPRGLRSRHLIVLHKQDACRVTMPSSGIASNRNFGTVLVEMEGGQSVGDDCGAWAHHGYNGVEAETVDRIKAWIFRE